MTTTKNASRLGGRIGVCLLVLAAGTVDRDALAGQQQPLPYVMTVIRDQAEGERMLAGEYESAIQKLTASNDGPAGFAARNNLCVALTKTGQLAAALEACDAALEQAPPPGSIVQFYERGKRYDGRAVALANRGVARAISGDEAGARRDFQEAARFGRYLEAPAVNLALLDGDEAAAATAAAR